MVHVVTFIRHRHRCTTTVALIISVVPWMIWLLSSSSSVAFVECWTMSTTSNVLHFTTMKTQHSNQRYFTNLRRYETTISSMAGEFESNDRQQQLYRMDSTFTTHDTETFRVAQPEQAPLDDGATGRPTSTNRILPTRQQQQQRRQFFVAIASMITTTMTIGSGLTVVPEACNAGEIGRRLNEAITTSELGISVRRSVVRGAQIMDELDLRAERFSDTYQLGSERSKQDQRPQPKRIPSLQQPFDVGLASKIIRQIDEVFCTITQIPSSTLQQRIQLVTDKVQPSFVRSGVQISSDTLSATATATATATTIMSVDTTPTGSIDTKATLPIIQIENGPQFNFLMYVHYKSYTELWIETFGSTNGNNNIKNKKDFAPFQKQFEQQVGQDLLTLLLPTLSLSSSSSVLSNAGSGFVKSKNDVKKIQNDQERAFYDAIRRIDEVSTILVSKGFVAQVDRTHFDNDNNKLMSEDVTDWSQQLLSDLSFSIALDNDITLSSQILLQEQGIRFYPNYIRCMVQSILQQSIGIPFQQRISTEDYYLDTDYNSDPDKFEVKEVLININIENIQ